MAAESGTGSLLGAAIGPYTSGEQALALDLLDCLGEGMLVLADRNFLSWSLARDVLATGARILWRASFALKPVKVLADGTYLAELRPPRKKDGPAVTVRVIEYTVHTAPATAARQAPQRYSAWSRTSSTPSSTRRSTWPAATRNAGGARP